MIKEIQAGKGPMNLGNGRERYGVSIFKEMWKMKQIHVLQKLKGGPRNVGAIVERPIDAWVLWPGVANSVQ